MDDPSEEEVDKFLIFQYWACRKNESTRLAPKLYQWMAAAMLSSSQEGAISGVPLQQKNSVTCFTVCSLPAVVHDQKLVYSAEDLRKEMGPWIPWKSQK